MEEKLKTKRLNKLLIEKRKIVKESMDDLKKDPKYWEQLETLR